jgi:hypothetical protein
MSGFTKLVPEIIQSSIWNEPSDIRIVWITLLAVKDENGYVRGDVRTIARLANVDVEAAGRAIDAFLAPDPGSHTPDNEGRRIGTAAGGYVVLNHALYRGRDAKAEHAEYVKKWRAEREKQSDVIKCDSRVNHASASASVSDIKKGVQGETKPVKPSVDLPFASDSFAAVWSQYLEHRTRIRKPMTPYAQKLALAKLPKVEADAVRWINTAIEKGWQGIYNPDSGPGSKAKNTEQASTIWIDPNLNGKDFGF